MKCHVCNEELMVKKWITNYWFGDIVIFEILFWTILLPLMFLGSFYYLIIVIVISFIVITSWGKRWLKCKKCNYSKWVKISEIKN